MVFVIAGVVLVVLRLLELWPVATLSWWWVLVPFACAVVWWAIKDAAGWTQRDQMRKVDDKKAERRRRALEALGQRRKPR
jgi:small Trp-rich protein